MVKEFFSCLVLFGVCHVSLPYKLWGGLPPPRKLVHGPQRSKLRKVSLGHNGVSTLHAKCRIAFRRCRRFQRAACAVESVRKKCRRFNRWNAVGVHGCSPFRLYCNDSLRNRKQSPPTHTCSQVWTQFSRYGEKLVKYNFNWFLTWKFLWQFALWKATLLYRG